MTLRLIMSHDLNARFTHENLKYVNSHAIETKKNRVLQEEFVDSLDANLKFPILNVFSHNEEEFRLQILFDESGTSGLVDVDCDVLHDAIDYLDVPSMEEFHKRLFTYEDKKFAIANIRAFLKKQEKMERNIRARGEEHLLVRSIDEVRAERAEILRLLDDYEAGFEESDVA